MSDYCKAGDIVDIADERFIRQADVVRYRYEVSAVTCPVCACVGIPWGGWFSCDRCRARALVDTGETFLPTGGNQ